MNDELLIDKLLFYTGFLEKKYRF